MDCYLVVIHWPSEAFGGDRIWNLAIKTTDGATIFTYLGKGDKFRLINKWEKNTMKNEVEVRGIDWSSECNYTIKFCCVMIYFLIKNAKLFWIKETKNSGPSRQTYDQALGWVIWTNLIISNLNWTVLLCASKKFMNKCWGHYWLDFVLKVTRMTLF